MKQIKIKCMGCNRFFIKYNLKSSKICNNCLASSSPYVKAPIKRNMNYNNINHSVVNSFKKRARKIGFNA